jgi:hypothetical protein
MQLELALISHKLENNLIHQRAADGYVNATAMCKAVGKNFADYRRLNNTDAFLKELSTSMGIPIDLLVITVVNGTNDQRGTYVHPDVAINLGQWCSPKFAVAVSKWVREWATGKFSKAKLPYHLARYLANRGKIPHTHFSILNELALSLIAPLEQEGYTLPETMVPDISEGRMFSAWLRNKAYVPESFPSYEQEYEDGRKVQARLYPIELMFEFRKHFYEVWIPKRMRDYFEERDAKALPYVDKILLQLKNGPPILEIEG